MELQEKINAAIEGEICPLLLMAEIKSEMEKLENAKAALMSYALSELQRSLSGNEKSFRKQGYEFSITQSGRYSYDHAEIYKEQQEKIKSIEEKMKTAQKLGQAEYIDPETGEIYPTAIYKPNSPSITIKFKQ